MKTIHLCIILAFSIQLHSQPPLPDNHPMKRQGMERQNQIGGAPPWGGGGKPPCVPPPCIPIDSGLMALLLGGLVYGFKQSKKIG